MSLERRIFYNTVAQSLGKIGAALLGLLTLGLLSRYLEEQGFGQYSTVLAFLGVFVVLADLGLYLIVVREISKPETNSSEIIGNALGLRLLTGLVVLILGSLLALVFPYDPLVKKTMFIGIGAFLFISLNQVLVGVFQKHLVQYLVVLTETVGRGVNLLLVYLFIQEGLSLPFFVIALLAGNGATFLLTLSFAKRYERFGIAFDLKVWKKILYSSWPLVFAVFLNLMYFKTDTVILSVFHSEEAVGVYSLPYRLLEGFLAFPAMFVGLVMPMLSSRAFAAWDKFQSVLQRSFDALVIMAFPLVLGVQFFSREIIDLLKGEQQYVDSPALLQILIVATAIIFFGTLFGYSVVAVDKQKAMIKGYLLGAAVGLLLYFSLIPAFSYWGAAVGTVVAEAIVAVYAYFLVKKTSGAPISGAIIWKITPSLAALALFLWLVHLPWLLEVFLGAAVYALLLILTRAVPKEFLKDVLFAEKFRNGSF